MICELVEYCQFFNDKMKDMPKSADYIKSRFCLGDHESCARFKIYKEYGGEPVPLGMFPNDNEEVNKIIRFLQNKPPSELK